MALNELAGWLETRRFAVFIAQSDWLFPALETVHVLAIALVVGSIAMLDLRLLGLCRKRSGVIELAAETLPWTWVAFAVALLTGSLMFASAATRYLAALPFQMKLALLLAAGINMGVFHLGAYRDVGRWNNQLPTPRPAKIAGALSLSFWVAIVFCGRWIGFV